MYLGSPLVLDYFCPCWVVQFLSSLIHSIEMFQRAFCLTVLYVSTQHLRLFFLQYFFVEFFPYHPPPSLFCWVKTFVSLNRLFWMTWLGLHLTHLEEVNCLGFFIHWQFGHLVFFAFFNQLYFFNWSTWNVQVGLVCGNAMCGGEKIILWSRSACHKLYIISQVWYWLEEPQLFVSPTMQLSH